MQLAFKINEALKPNISDHIKAELILGLYL